MKDLFLYGATWLRADFHLHTNADKEFKYTADKNFYYSNYVDALVKADINVGVITNHNKFDFEEYKTLRKTSQKKNIFLLPGVELSISDGSNGIHTLIIFSDEWLENENDRISAFITSMFPGKAVAEYQNENGQSDKNILQTVEELEKIGRDFFLVFAHVEDSKGLWKETGGGRLTDWRNKRYQTVKKRTLGFQQVKTNDDKEKVKKWLKDWYPAEVEGSDPKNIDQIGQKKRCYLKLGAFTFEAVKFALIDHKNRLRLGKIPEYTHSHIRQIRFEGGTLDGQTVRFSPELNTFIGIRGSGKSSILEALRYVLRIKIEDNDGEYKYKHELIEHTLGSGGKIILDVKGRLDQDYQIQRVWKDKAFVYIDNKLQPGISIRETVLSSPLFFGQKEIASSDKGYEEEIIEKLISTKCDEIRGQIIEQKSKITDVINRLQKVSNVEEQIEEQINIKNDVKHRLDFYKKHKLEEKLQKRLGFETDIRKAEEGISLVEDYIIDVKDLLAKHEDELRNYPGYVSSYNAKIFEKLDSHFSKIIISMESIKAELAKSEKTLQTLKKEYEKLLLLKNDMSDEFATIERTLAKEIKSSKGQNISTNDFLSLKKLLASSEAKLMTLSKSSGKKNVFQNELFKELRRLNELWLKEYQIIKKELDEVSQKNKALKFSIGFKENKEAFYDYIKYIFKGSNIRDTIYKNIAEKYQDFIEIYNDFENAKKMFGSNIDKFIDSFNHNLNTLLTYQTLNKFTITYRGTKLAHHSLGQRASAMILFILEKREHDVIIIDQPEDDLDNQTIYDDVIKLIRELKPNVQFIFATHNPNIPVLGDAEQVHACSLSDGKIDVLSGGLDDIEQQKRIVKIMEGGKEAFERRKEIYQAWKQ